MSLVMLLIVGTILGSTSLVSALAKGGFLNSALTRAVAGGSIYFTSSTFLVYYTNFESFLSASANGSLGLAGFVFIGGLVALLLTWVSNLIEYEVAVQ